MCKYSLLPLLLVPMNACEMRYEGEKGKWGEGRERILLLICEMIHLESF